MFFDYYNKERGHSSLCDMERKLVSSYVLDFQEIDKTKQMLAGGKGANLGELSRTEGIRVPDGFCISTEAFRRIIGEAPLLDELLDQLALLKPRFKTGGRLFVDVTQILVSANSKNNFLVEAM